MAMPDCSLRKTCHRASSSRIFSGRAFSQTWNVVASAKQDRNTPLFLSLLCYMLRSFDSASMDMEVDILRGGASKQLQGVAAKPLELNQGFLLPLVKTVAAFYLKHGLLQELSVGVKQGEEPRSIA